MTTKPKDGGPAFPRSLSTVGEVGNYEPEFSDPQEGMTLRDYFAAKAMMSLLSNWEPWGLPGKVAKRAYGYADAMLAEREKDQP